MRILYFLAGLLVQGFAIDVGHAQTGNRVVILYDAFGRDAAMTKDWGYSAWIEYGGRTVLFDAGNDAQIFARNVQAAGMDPGRLDFAVFSHRHLDHTAGLNYLLQVNPGVKIYAPKESFGVFGSALPSSFYRKDETLPESMRYYSGRPPEVMRFGTPWVGARIQPIEERTEIAPGMHLLSLISDAPGTKELRELSLVIATPKGLVVIAGCSHPGIDRIVEAARGIDPRVYLVMGGFHLPAAPDEQVSRIATRLHDDLGVERLAPGHCTGEPAFALFRRVWGEAYTFAGVGEVIALP
jgi:7,8-dihydropterin-6-yl-methyl-4-(beta-D-ribofuranosyl)aminobenzene 5'-phosphate synthase